MNLFIKKIKEKIDLTIQEEKHLLSIIKTKTYAKNDFFVESGSICKKVGYIEKGLMRIYNVDSSSNDITNWLATDHELVTEILSFINQEPAQEHIQCLEETTILYITYNDLHDLYKIIPKMHVYTKLVNQDLIIDIKKYLLSNIHLSAEERYRQLLNVRPTIIKKAPLKYIASFLGITDSTLSRVRKKIVVE